MPFLTALLLLILSSQSFAETEIGFKRFKEIVRQNVNHKLKIIEQDPLDAESYFNLGLEYMA